MIFGEKVKYVRIKLKLTQSQLSKEAGIPKSTIIKWENDPNTKPQAINYGKFIDFCEKNNINFKKDEVITNGRN